MVFGGRHVVVVLAAVGVAVVAGQPVMSLMPAWDSTLTPTSAIMTAHHCGFWDAVNRTAPWAP